MTYTENYFGHAGFDEVYFLTLFLPAALHFEISETDDHVVKLSRWGQRAGIGLRRASGTNQPNQIFQATNTGIFILLVKSQKFHLRKS